MSFNITPVASGYQEIHPYSAMNIDSVKINTSLIMMKEWHRQNVTAVHSVNCEGGNPRPTSNDDYFQTKPKSNRPMSIEDQVKIYLGDQVLKNIIPASTDEKSQSAILNFATWNLTSSHRLTILGRLWGSGQRRERSIIRRFMLRPDQVFGKIEDDVDLDNNIFRHHTIVGIFEQCRRHWRPFFSWS